jgi:ribosomal protein S18 acetylase RimI-like enzyme
VAAIEQVVRDAYAVYIPRIGRSPAPVDADYAALVAAGEVWVADHDGRPVGVLVIRTVGSELLLENVAVAPHAQGRGLGRSLIRFAEQRARATGLAAVVLYTNELMTENLRLYPALGYAETGRRSEHGFRRVFFRRGLAPR